MKYLKLNKASGIYDLLPVDNFLYATGVDADDTTADAVVYVVYNIAGADGKWKAVKVNVSGFESSEFSVSGETCQAAIYDAVSASLKKGSDDTQIVDVDFGDGKLVSSAPPIEFPIQ